MTPLPRPSIDTGMGLERIAAVVQGKRSNYDSDLFRPIIEAIGQIAANGYGADHKKDTSMRAVADHARSAAFLIADGVLPANDGRGYVLRRIMRRALRHGKLLGSDRPVPVQGRRRRRGRDGSRLPGALGAPDVYRLGGQGRGRKIHRDPRQGAGAPFRGGRDGQEERRRRPIGRGGLQAL